MGQGACVWIVLAFASRAPHTVRSCWRMLCEQALPQMTVLLADTQAAYLQLFC
jgi:hypothetical protein